MFNRLKQFRRITARFDKSAKSFAAFLALSRSKDF
jgi:transposase